MTLEQRATGWLDALHHATLREYLVHALGRFGLVCPAYCVMPDHAHFLWLGVSDASDHKRGVSLLREAWNAELARGRRTLQKQPFDHVLRENERERGAFAAVASYIFENPVRAGLVGQWQDYPFSDALIPGYPKCDPRDEDFWERFWRIYEQLSARAATDESLTASAPKRT